MRYSLIVTPGDEIDLKFPKPPVALQDGKASSSKVFLGAVFAERPQLCPGQW